MSITLAPAAHEDLEEADDALASWQVDGHAVQLHPGDLGWHGREGADVLVGELRLWRRSGELVALGLVDAGERLVRVAVAPGVSADGAVADRLVSDLADPRSGVLDGGALTVEARYGTPWPPCRPIAVPAASLHTTTTALRSLLRRSGQQGKAALG